MEKDTLEKQIYLKLIKQILQSLVEFESTAKLPFEEIFNIAKYLETTILPSAEYSDWHDLSVLVLAYFCIAACNSGNANFYEKIFDITFGIVMEKYGSRPPTLVIKFISRLKYIEHGPNFRGFNFALVQVPLTRIPYFSLFD